MSSPAPETIAERSRRARVRAALDSVAGAGVAGSGGAGVVEAFAPGRINLIGDHIDYVGGTVVPMSIDRGTWFAARRRAAPGIRVQTLDVGETAVCHAGEDPDDAAAATAVQSGAGHWSRFVRGLLALASTAENETGTGTAAGTDARPGAEIVVSGELAGGGLSSSASFCVGMAMVLMELDCIPRLRGMTLARCAQQVEHDWLGVACGIMDQAAVVAGREDGALELDCRTGRTAPVMLDWGARSLLAIRSRGDRRLADGAYNQRRAELAAGLARLGKAPDLIPELNPAGMQDIEADDLPLRRVRHIVGEQRLVREALAAARRGDWPAFGAALTASHASLRDDYAVSTPELDRIVDAATATAGCEGARLTGAGFGGWAIALVRDAALDAVLAAVGRARGAPLTTGEWFVARPGGAARILQPTRERQPRGVQP